MVIADNRLPEQAVWDFDLLRGHFTELIEVDFDVKLTGFSTGEIDLLLDGKPGLATDDPVDDLTGFTLDGPAVSQPPIARAAGSTRLTPTGTPRSNIGNDRDGQSRDCPANAI